MTEVVQKILNQTPAVSSVIEGRAWLGFRPQDDRRPGVVIKLVSARPAHTFDGPGGYVQGTVQVDVLTGDYALTRSLANAVAAALDDFTGTVDGVAVDYIELADAGEIPAAPLAGRAIPTFGIGLELHYQHQK